MPTGRVNAPVCVAPWEQKATSEVSETSFEGPLAVAGPPHSLPPTHLTLISAFLNVQAGYGEDWTRAKGTGHSNHLPASHESARVLLPERNNEEAAQTQHGQFHDPNRSRSPRRTLRAAVLP